MEYWIARDKDDELCLYTGDEPKRENNSFVPQPYGKADYYVISEELFPEVTWENSPQKVKIELIRT